MDGKRAELDKEFTSLNLQADSRARLDLKREALRSKTTEMKNLSANHTRSYSQHADYFCRLEINKTKFRRLVGTEARAETMEREAERVSVSVYST